MKGIEKLERAASRHLCKAEKVNRALIDESKRYAPYIFGEKPVYGDGGRRARPDDKAEARRIIEGMDQTSLPMHGTYRQIVLPYLFSNDPLFINEDREGADAFERAQSDLYARLTGMFWEKCEATREVQRALDDAFGMRLGWVETFFDYFVKRVVHRWVDARDMLVDADTKSPRLSDRRWVGRKLVLPMETADWFARNVWDASKYEFTPISFEETDAAVRVEATTPDGALSSQIAADLGERTDFVQLVLMHVQGDNPYVAAEAKQAKAGIDDFYTGKPRVLIFEACGGWEGENYKLVGETGWQYPCDHGAYPYTPFVLTKDNTGLYPYSIMQPVHTAQVATDLSVQSYMTDVVNSCKRIVGLQRELFQDEQEIDAATVQRQTLTVVNLKMGAQLTQAVQIGEFGKPPESLRESANIMQGAYWQTASMSPDDLKVRANQTAYSLGVQKEAQQVKLEDMSGLVIAGVVAMARKGIQCARKMMTNDDVARFVHIPDEVDGKRVSRESLKEGGGTEIENDLWPNDSSDAEIRESIGVDIEPLSMRFQSPDKMAADITELMNYQLQVFRIIGDTVAKQGVAAAREIARTANESIRAIAKLKNVLNYERFIINVDAIMPPEPPPPSGDGLLQATAANQQATEGMVNAQQEAAMTRMQNMGISAEAIPQEMQPA